MHYKEPTAKLANELSKIGFELNYPSYETSLKIIEDLLETNDERIKRAIPLIIMNNDINKKECLELLKKYNCDIKIELYLKIREIIKKENIEYYDKKILNLIKKEETDTQIYDAIELSSMALKERQKNKINKEFDILNSMNLSKALNILFAPGKLRIMEKIKTLESLTPTEYAYYIQKIKPTIKASLLPELQRYIEYIELTKKRRLI